MPASAERRRRCAGDRRAALGREGRLDFDVDTKLEKAAVQEELNALIERDLPVAARWISDEALAAQPELVKTMRVKPPSGHARVRVIEVDGIDLQPCGGTHVARTGEIGPVIVRKIESKGRAQTGASRSCSETRRERR